VPGAAVAPASPGNESAVRERVEKIEKVEKADREPLAARAPLPSARASRRPPVPALIAGAAAVVIAIVAGVFLLFGKSGDGKAAGPPVAARSSASPASASASTSTAPAAADPAPPAAAPSGTTGLADIVSAPSGASVMLGGFLAGQTPLNNLEVLAGTHTIAIAKAGHETWSGQLVVEPGGHAQLSAELKPVSAKGGASAADVYLENDVDTAPRPVAGVPVSYPADAPGLGAGESKSTTVSFVILEDGSVTRVELVESGGAALDAAVVGTVGKWKFTAAVKQGTKVKVRLTRKFTFRG
jgi:TonB family protein